MGTTHRLACPSLRLPQVPEEHEVDVDDDPGVVGDATNEVAYEDLN